MIDHVSLSWSVWTSVSIFTTDGKPTAGDITIVDSIVAESLACSGVNNFIACDPARYPTTGFSNSRGMLIRYAAGVTLVRNVFANINDRHPETGGPTQTVLVNNMIYNPSLTPWAGVLFARILFTKARRFRFYRVTSGRRSAPHPDTTGTSRRSIPKKAKCRWCVSMAA